MSQAWKAAVADWLPPAALRWYARRRGVVRYRGDYPTWDAARAASHGYDDTAILERVTAATRLVRDGRAAFERDGLVFQRHDYAWPVLAALLRVAARHQGRLSVLDFGGALGSTYWQTRPLLGDLADLRWAVVEQSHFVDRGRREFETPALRFFRTPEECLDVTRPNLLLLSSVLPYLPDPRGMLARLLGLPIAHVVVDRTPVRAAARDRLTVQHIAPAIYGQAASYPAWILSEPTLRDDLTRRHDLIAEFPAIAGVIDLGDGQAEDRGYILDLRRPPSQP